MNERYHIDRAKSDKLILPANNQSAASMRKYQQLALALVSIVSLIAFLFYKHEYDRLHYTFEYLETFGTIGDENNVNFCGNQAYRKLYTAPTFWQTLAPNIAVYSTFWDVKSSSVLALAIYKGSHNVSVSITSESNSTAVTLECSLKQEEAKFVKQVGLMSCPGSVPMKKPFLAKYKVDNDTISHPIPVQRSEDWKSVANATCVCVFSLNEFVPTKQIVEFVAYHNGIGVEKFIFYGDLLAPTIRKILDTNGDEMGIFYEEKLFNLPPEFSLTVEEYRKLVETDCALRHKNFYDNVIALQPNEYLIINGKRSINALISSLQVAQPKISSFIFKYNLMTQYACYEMAETNKSFVAMDLKVFGDFRDNNVALIRPHLAFNPRFNHSSDQQQQIPTSSLAIYNFVDCSTLKLSSYDSLSMHTAYSSVIERSALYRKWKIYD